MQATTREPTTTHDHLAIAAPAPSLAPSTKRACLVTAFAMIAAAAIGSALLGPERSLTAFFFLAQDVPALFAGGVLLAALALVRPGSPRWRVLSLARARPVSVIALAGLAVLVVAIVGTFALFRDYPLSRDEVMADFDADILRTGRLVGPVPASWRPFAAALQPLFRLPVPGDVAWISSYYPGNAALRAAVSLLFPMEWTGPLLAALAVAAVAGVARRLWPDRPDAALVAALLVATSPQVLFTAMTPYAMSAHLALNLVWLWLFGRDDRAGHLGAIAVGFLAAGLHQVVFHPLFVAPFLLQLALARRWRLLAGYMAGYALIAAFWATYWRIALAGSDIPPAAVAASGVALFLQRIQEVLAWPTLDGCAAMALNLVRFVAWQNPIVWPLAAFGTVLAWRQPGPLRPIAGGLVLTTVAVFLLLPYQGHGWGYRYLHGLIGNLALLAAAGWVALGRRSPLPARALLIRVTAATLLVLLPLRAYQVARFVWPYADSYAAIADADAQAVLVDADGIGFGQDLVRNDPFLRNAPLVFDLAALDGSRIRELCSRYRVAVFDRMTAQAYGVPGALGDPLNGPKRALLTELGCGVPLVGPAR